MIFTCEHACRCCGVQHNSLEECERHLEDEEDDGAPLPLDEEARDFMRAIYSDDD